MNELPERFHVERGAAPPCPTCASTAVVPIVYGYPDEELFRAADRGEAEVGGCVVMHEQPLWRCRSCGAAWGSDDGLWAPLEGPATA